MPQLDLATYPSQIFWLSIFFAMLYVFVQKYVTPAINSLTKLRKIKIEQDIQQAVAATDATHDLQQQYDNLRQRALSKISEMLEGELSNLNSITKQKNDLVMLDINKQLQQVEEEIAQQRANYIKELDAVVINYSLFLIKKIADLDVTPTELTKYKNV